MPDFVRKPEIIVFAGPNGSGKTTITKLAKTIEPYINADDIKKATLCSDIDAAIQADKMRNQLVEQNQSFTFETVLSTERNLLLLKKAKDRGYFIRCIYVLTSDPQINILRVRSRFALGGHDVPEDKIRSRYNKALKLIPKILGVCDVCHIYDNTDEAFRIFKMRKDEFFYWESEFWNRAQIQELVGIEL